MSPRPGWQRALGDLGGALLPLAARDLLHEVDDRIRKIPTRLNEFGFDPWGLHPESVRQSILPVLLLYRYWFRVETAGIEQVPPGGVLLIANHAGQLPFDAAMVMTAMLLEADPPRILRSMAEYWVPQLPFVSELAARGGAVAGTPETCREMLDAGEAVLVFPEGVRGMNKLYRDRYRLQRFGTGFLRLALAAQVPIVPIAVVGSEEQQPGLANLRGLGQALGMPAFPITPTFPWLGPLGLLPLPVKYRIYFGEPMHFQGSPTDEDAVIEEQVARVREAIEALFARGLAERRGVFT
ncbi:MAG: lysophospholipid acyltransferase family protein [Deltaproteobacteria bacterium]|nr:lysophospholipid acyltransferase family protein [Deltaproteobacteria bacterium]